MQTLEFTISKVDCTKHINHPIRKQVKFTTTTSTNEIDNIIATQDTLKNEVTGMRTFVEEKIG